MYVTALILEPNRGSEERHRTSQDLRVVTGRWLLYLWCGQGKTWRLQVKPIKVKKN